MLVSCGVTAVSNWGDWRWCWFSGLITVWTWAWNCGSDHITVFISGGDTWDRGGDSFTMLISCGVTAVSNWGDSWCRFGGLITVWTWTWESGSNNITVFISGGDTWDRRGNSFTMFISCGESTITMTVWTRAWNSSGKNITMIIRGSVGTETCWFRVWTWCS
ncbi:unnamed protein product [Ambrosiozyma monospora]|uniref:Unnamed protein product n=1 Tax=Ambrosiozyma monospora TaxID=43982 RepID=A0A9W6Z6D5_AMBMO|nr:unnamed protein product [Ambrosiozyma monospora]